MMKIIIFLILAILTIVLFFMGPIGWIGIAVAWITGLFIIKKLNE